MQNNFLHYTRHQITQEDKDAVLRVMDSGCLSRGKEVRAFEEEFAAYVGAKHAIACTSGTAALHLACMELISSTDKIDVPVVTFAATANAPMLCGLKVNLYDNMSPEGTPFKGIIVHYAGEPYQDREALIEDAAHALGAKYHDGAMVGSCPESLMTCFSFHPTKHITCGEGGMVTTNDGDIAHRLRLVRGNGIERGYSDEPWRYSWVTHGLNYEMSEMNAALGRSQLKRMRNNLAVRRGIAYAYQTYLPENVQPVIPRHAGYIHADPCSYHLSPVLIDFETLGKSRQQVMAELLKRGIETQVHYTPLHLQPMFAEQYAPDAFPHAMEFYRQELSLPMHNSMSVDDAQRVCDALKEILR